MPLVSLVREQAYRYHTRRNLEKMQSLAVEHWQKERIQRKYAGL